MEFDKQLVKILKEKYESELKEVGSAYYNTFLLSNSKDSLKTIASILIENEIEFSFDWDKEDGDGSFILLTDDLNKLKIGLRKLI
jgi:hypothetical protein